MNTIAIIPARGGSKAIPGKNIRPLAGRPLVAHTIAHARAARAISRVIVSTDDDAIARASEDAGADVVRRPAELATDTAPSEAALLHVLASLKADGQSPDAVVFLQCTSPLRRPGEIDAAIEYFERGGYDSLFTAVRTFPFRWRREADGSMVRMNYAVGDRPMRQAREPEFVETGSFYITRQALLVNTGLRLGGRIGCWEQPPLFAIDIDEPEDFALVEAVLPFVTSGIQTS